MPFDPSAITVVSGLPRSGTSMLMKMLSAGGMPILSDGLRGANADNPAGYFEYEPVKALRRDASWMPQAVGKAVKVVSFLLPDLPTTHRYKVIFVRRALPEVLASQRQMLLRRGEAEEATGDEEMGGVYEKHLRHIYRWLARQDHLEATFLDHGAIIAEPTGAAHAVNTLLGGNLDPLAMARAVDPALYRQRHNR
jgi:hypothetical protein